MNITTQNAKKVYSTTVNGMRASAQQRLKASGFVNTAPIAKKITNLNELEDLYCEVFNANQVFKYSQFMAAVKIVGNEQANKMQARLIANER